MAGSIIRALPIFFIILGAALVVFLPLGLVAATKWFP
jgi:hypothetical protein